MIQLSKLKKIFRTEDIETLALNGINLEIQKEEFVAIMGPSGCGKSTLLNILGMLDKPSEGNYLFNEKAIENLSNREKTILRKTNLGFIFQSFNLIEQLTVFENVELPLVYQRIKSSERKKMVKAILERMKIAHREHHFPQQLSGGQQQRAAIARAVIGKPQLILADEPTGNLDSKNGEEVMRLLTELNQEGTTIVMVTHSERDAHYAHRVVHLFDGRIVSENLNALINN